MLTHLRISNFALLDELELEFGRGFHVLTGETGAGKSLLVDAVALLRGGRASAEVVRSGAEEARIEAIFAPEGTAERALAERLSELGIEPAAAGDGLLVRRVVGGRSRVHLNGSLATAASLGEVVGRLIELMGQHEHQALGEPGRQLAILDAYGGDPALGEGMAAAYRQITVSAEMVARCSLDERTRAEREDFLRFQLREIDEAALEPGEDERLRLERERLQSAEKLQAASQRAAFALYEREAAITEELGRLGRELAEVGRADPELATLGRQLDEARVTLVDLAESLRRYADGVSADPERLALIDERRHQVARLLRKHGASVTQVLERAAELRAELHSLGSQEEARAAATQALATAREEALLLGQRLTETRRTAAKALAKKVSATLAELGMAGARFVVAVEERPAREGDDAALTFARARLGPSGFDRIEFRLAANRGDEARPIGRVASGGELSRVMLALRCVLSRADPVSTYVFDEVDAGIGGAVADVVGRTIRAVADEKQVLCVTHLAAIAAYADVHFRVEKQEQNGRTRTTVRRLSQNERIDELARMAGDGRITEKARAHAKDLLKHAQI